MMGNNRLTKVRAQLRNPIIQLGAAAFLSFVVYALLLVRPIYLYDWFQIQHLDGNYEVWADPDFKRRTISAFICLGVLYWFGWRTAQKTSGRAAWVIVVGGSLAFSAVLTLLMPFDAADIFDNIVHGRILGIYGENPFIQVGNQFKQDHFVPYMAWPRSPTAYGPVWEALAGITARLAGDGVPANIILFKWLAGIFYVAAIGITALLLRRKAPERALAGTLFLAWNPVVLYETLGNGHNDIAMVVWMLAAAWAVAERRFTLAMLATILGGLVKYIPILLAPAVLFMALRTLPEKRARLRYLGVTGLLCGALIVLAYAPFWEGLRTLSIERRAGMFSASLPATIFQLIQDELGEELASTLVSQGAALLTMGFALWQGWRASRLSSWEAFVQAGFNILMFYLLFTCLWFQQWYTLWPTGLAALLPVGASTHLALVFGFAALSKQFVIGPVLFRLKHAPSQPWFELQFIAGILLVPWLYAAFLWSRARRLPSRQRVERKKKR